MISCYPVMLPYEAHDEQLIETVRDPEMGLSMYPAFLQPNLDH